MKTPEEIKEGLEHCSEDGCKGCNYEEDCNMADGFSVLAFDALAYIQQLEQINADFAERTAQLEAQVPKWISVEDRLPEVGQKVMVCGLKKGMQVGAFRGLMRAGRNRVWQWKKDVPLEVTHWMPLPEPPKKE